VERHNGKVDVTVRVRNTGRVTGTDVPQAYLTLPAAADEPSQRLVAFDRVTLRAGRSATVRLTIDPDSVYKPLSIWDTTTHDWRILGGSYTVAVGSSAFDTPLRATFRVR
jgi:beta-glucosidase